MSDRLVSKRGRFSSLGSRIAEFLDATTAELLVAYPHDRLEFTAVSRQDAKMMGVLHNQEGLSAETRRRGW